jgi:uncharacterized membrane protein YbhN (UPF0104 family)
VVVLVALHLDLRGPLRVLSGADRDLLVLAAALYALAQTASGAMWAVCQRAGGVNGIPMRRALGMHWIARGACELLPVSLGEAVRMCVVRRHPAGAAAGGWRIAGGIAGYKLIDSALTGATVLAVAIALPLPGPASNLRWTATGALVVAIGVVACWRFGLLGGLTRRVPTRLRGAIGRLGEGAAVLGRPRAARVAALLGGACVAARVGSLAALLAALGTTPAAALLAFSMIVIAGAVPGVPGGAGTREAALVPALAFAHGVPTATALAFSVAVQGIALGVSLLAALAALAWLGPGLLTRRPVPASG